MQGTAAARKPRATTSAKPRANARTAPARRTTRPARRPTAGGSVIAFPAVAVGRTAHAVSGIADCGLVAGMARSRAWIGVLGVLLAGIVAINVVGLSLSASNSTVATKIDALERDNSLQYARISEALSTARIQKAASALGLAIPAPEAVHYLNAGHGDAAKAAERLAAGSISAAPPVLDAATTTETVTDPAAVVPAEPTVDPVTGATIDPATGAPIDPATGAPVVTDPAVTTITTDATVP